MNDWIRNTRDKLSPERNQSPKNLDGTLKKIVRAKKRKENKRDSFDDRMRNSLANKSKLSSRTKKPKSDLFQKKFKTFMLKNSLGILKNNKRLSSFDRNNSIRKPQGFLQRVINGSQKKMSLADRKSSATKQFRRNAQHQYFALRKMIKEKSVEFRNSANKTEKRNSIKNVMQRRYKCHSKDKMSPHLNSSYSLDELHRKFLARSKTNNGDSRFTAKENTSRNGDYSIGSDARSSRREYSLGMGKWEAKFKRKKLEKNHSALLRKFSNNSKLLLTSQKLGSFNPRVSDGGIEVRSLNKKVRNKIMFQKYRMTMDS